MKPTSLWSGCKIREKLVSACPFEKQPFLWFAKFRLVILRSVFVLALKHQLNIQKWISAHATRVCFTFYSIKSKSYSSLIFTLYLRWGNRCLGLWQTNYLHLTFLPDGPASNVYLMKYINNFNKIFKPS